MAIHFSAEELSERRQRAATMMRVRGLDALLMFRQESMYYLTGYDTFGYVFFQCLVLTADGRFALITRAPDLRQAQHTSVIEDIRIWVDGPDANPSLELRDMLDEFGLGNGKLGVEYEAYGLTAANGKRVDAALLGFANLVDASDVINRLRVVKSPTEIEFVREAAELADRALDAAHEVIGPGAFEGDILASLQGQIFKGGGDYPGNEFIIGSGDDALLCRYKSGRRTLSTQDQITLEFAGAYRHYHAAMMRTIVVGEASKRHNELHAVATDAMAACMEALKPGVPIGEVFDAYARACEDAGMREHRMNATGYSLGATFSPNWMDWPMFYHANPEQAEPNMVFFLHMILMDSDAHCAMCPGQTVLVTAEGCENLSRSPLDLIVR